MTDLRVLLVANYAVDGQRSMQRFAELLHDELRSRGVSVDLWRPPVRAGAITRRGRRVAKWLGYADKFLLFPPRLWNARRHPESDSIVHVCDHSNAVYVPWIRQAPHVVTCHDLLAVRAALAEFPETRTRWSGRRLQQLIRRGLRAAACVVCDSEATREDVRRIVQPAGNVRVVHPGLAPAFRPLPKHEAWSRVQHLLPSEWKPGGRFLLHVGGNQWYKNRSGVLDIYAALVARRPDAPPLVLAGAPLPAALTAAIADRSLAGRVVALADVSDADLTALYGAAALLLFPSLAEGFGWPVLEAMACGCRVAASGREPLIEVGGDAATYFDPTDPASAAWIVETVLDEPASIRQARVEAGVSRAAGFSARAMADRYLEVYRDALRARTAAQVVQ